MHRPVGVGARDEQAASATPRVGPFKPDTFGGKRSSFAEVSSKNGRPQTRREIRPTLTPST